MRNHLIQMLAATAAFSSAAWALKPGDPLTPDALAKGEIIQGEVPKAWEPGKLYILECWATGSQPSVAAIPHTDALHDKYKGQGLVVVGVDVWEDDKDKVAALVKQKGEGMSYPVVFTGGKGNAFDTAWLKPAGVNSLPYAFIVKDGKFLFGIHPGRLTGRAIEGLLAGGEKQDAVVRLQADEAARNAPMELMMAFQQAEMAKDADAMAASLAALEKLDPKPSGLTAYKIRLGLATKDWAGLEQSIQTLPDEFASSILLFYWAVELDGQADAPVGVLKAILGKLLKFPGGSERNLSDVLISRYQWRTGDKQAAIATANKALEKADLSEAVIYVAYANSLETDKPQTYKQLEAAFSNAHRNQKR